MAPKKPVGKGKKGGANMPMEDAIPPPLPMPGADFGVVTREVVRPSNQLQLSDADMNEEIAKMLTANNPQAPTNIARYNMKERAYKFEAMVEQTIVHYATDGWLVHKTSDDARKQLAEEKVQAEAIAKFQAEVDKAAADKERGVETQEPDDSRQLRNQFNFSERAAETVNFPMRDRETFTSPPPTATVSGSCTFWEIFDEYYRDVMRQRMEDSAKGKKKDVKEEKKAPAPPPVDVPPETMDTGPSGPGVAPGARSLMITSCCSSDLDSVQRMTWPSVEMEQNWSDFCSSSTCHATPQTGSLCLPLLAVAAYIGTLVPPRMSNTSTVPS